MLPKFAKTFIYISGFLFSAHLALTSYINSTVIGQNIDKSLVGIIYALSSVATITLLWLLPSIIKKFGIRKIVFLAILLTISSLIGLSVGINFLIPIFFLYLTINTLIVYSLDLLLEHYSKDDSTGGTRGGYLAISNLAWIFAPIITGFLIETFGYSAPYKIGLILVSATAIALFVGTRKFTEDIYPDQKPLENLKELKTNKNIRFIVCSNFLLQFFYSWMVIYTPIYLHETIGFAWSEIGLIFMIMLSPFAIFQFPLGKLADKILGEKELLILGFLIMSTATTAFAFLGNAPLISYAIVLFLTRVGASMVEVMTETYFFKQINATNSGVLSIFRSLIPTAFILGPLLGAIIFSFWSFTVLFVVLAIIMLLGVISSSLIVDTK